MTNFADNNRIKYMNGERFTKLPNLKHVALQLNICINEFFIDSSRIAILPQALNEKCRFDERFEAEFDALTVVNAHITAELNSINLKFNEVEAKLTTENEKLQSEVEKLISQLETAQDAASKTSQQVKELVRLNTRGEFETKSLQEANAKITKELEKCKSQIEGCKSTKKEMENCKSTVTELKSEKDELKKEVTTLKADVKSKENRYHQQFATFQSLQESLELNLNATCTAKTNELRNELRMKCQESFNNLHQMETDIMNKNAEIQNLKKKIQLLIRV